MPVSIAKPSFLAVLFFIGVSVSAGFASSDGKDLSYGIASYQSCDYTRALVYLARAVKSDPNNATSHYYLACAYQKSGQPTQAIAEYRLAKGLDREGTIARYANKALSQYAVAAAKSTSATEKPANQSLTKTAELIGRQAEEGWKNSEQISAAKASWAQHTEPDETVSSQPADGDYNKRIQLVRENTAGNVQRSLALGSQKKAALDDCANSLQSQLKPGAVGSSAVRLVPEGTSLFVRNYAASPNVSPPNHSPPQPELVATQKQLILVPHQSVWQVVPAPDIRPLEEQTVRSQDGSSVQVKVRGVVLPGG